MLRISKNLPLPFLTISNRHRHRHSSVAVLLKLDHHLLLHQLHRNLRSHLRRDNPSNQPRRVLHLCVHQIRLHQHVHILRHRFADLAQRHAANFRLVAEPSFRNLLGRAVASLAPMRVDGSNEAALVTGRHLRVGEVLSSRFRAGPELLGVGLQEVEDACLLRGEVAPVVDRVHVMLEEVVQDEAAEELLAAQVLVCLQVAEGEFEVGGLEAGFVGLLVFGLDHGGDVWLGAFFFLVW